MFDEEIFETGAQEVHQHDVVLAFGGDSVNLTRDRGTLGMPGTLPNELRYL